MYSANLVLEILAAIAENFKGLLEAVAEQAKKDLGNNPTLIDLMKTVMDTRQALADTIKSQKAVFDATGRIDMDELSDASYDLNSLITISTNTFRALYPRASERYRELEWKIQDVEDSAFNFDVALSKIRMRG